MKPVKQPACPIADKNMLFLVLICTACHTCFAEKVFLTRKAVLSNPARTLHLNGASVFKKLNQNIYVAALYLEQLTSDGEMLVKNKQAKRMEFQIVAPKLSARQFIQMLLEALAINNDNTTTNTFGLQISAFSRLFKNSLYRGDSVQIDFIPSYGTEVLINQKSIGQIRGIMLYRMLLRSWIGEHPPSSRFKREILGTDKRKDSNNIQLRYSS